MHLWEFFFFFFFKNGSFEVTDKVTSPEEKHTSQAIVTAALIRPAVQQDTKKKKNNNALLSTWGQSLMQDETHFCSLCWSSYTRESLIRMLLQRAAVGTYVCMYGIVQNHRSDQQGHTPSYTFLFGTGPCYRSLEMVKQDLSEIYVVGLSVG